MSLFRKSGVVLQILQDAKGLITPEANFASWQAIEVGQPVDSSGRYVNSDKPAAYQWICQWSQPDAVGQFRTACESRIAQRLVNGVFGVQSI